MIEGDPRRRALIGAVGGTVGALVHSAVMLIGHTYAPRARRQPTPPRQITAAVAARTGPASARTGLPLALGTVVLHFGYGALAGALCAQIMGNRGHPLARGALYGVGVWAGSYLGWLPALGLPPPATRQPPQQNVTMVLAHLVWGAALGATVARAERR